VLVLDLEGFPSFLSICKNLAPVYITQNAAVSCDYMVEFTPSVRINIYIYIYITYIRSLESCIMSLNSLSLLTSTSKDLGLRSKSFVWEWEASALVGS
jgi:hypothetical protein